MARLSKKKVSEAIRIYRGNLSRAAEACGVTRTHIYKFINLKAPELWDEIKEARETVIDDLEQKGYEVAMRGHAGMIQFFLNSIGKERGFVGRSETALTDRNGGDLVVRYVNDWRNPSSDSS